MAEKETQEKDTSLDNMGDINSDENIRGSAHLQEPVSEGTEDEKWQAEVADLKDRLLRQAAEFDNFRKRTARERLDLIQTAGREVISELLEVLDDAERAESQWTEASEPEQLKQGIALIFAKLRNKLNARGLKAMETKHAEFNPDLHEAITEIPAPNDSLKGRILDEVVKGYYLNDKIIRHAKVVVGK